MGARRQHAPPGPTRRRAPTPADCVVLLAVAALVPASWAWKPEPDRAAVLVVRSADGESRFEASQDREMEIRGPVGVTRLRLQDGEAWIVAAPCANHFCQRLGRLRAPGRSLVCVPNRVVVCFAGSGLDVDGVTR